MTDNQIKRVREDIKHCLDNNQEGMNTNVRETLQNILDYTQTIECSHCHKEIRTGQVKFINIGCLNVPSPYCQSCVTNKSYQEENKKYS